MSVRQTYDDGYVFCGSIVLGDSIVTAALIKTNGYGDSVWTRSFFGATWSLGRCVRQTSDSGYVLVGDRGFDGIFLIKTNQNGDTLWTKTFGNSDFGGAIQQTFDGGYIINGYNNSTNSRGIYLIKTDA